MFLSFIGTQLGIDIAYNNHSGFVSCFILRFIRLDKPVLLLSDIDLALGCEEGYIEPDFSEIIGKEAIILTCTLRNASFLSSGESLIPDGDTPDFLQDDLRILLPRLVNIVYDNVFTTFRMYGDTVEFISFSAYSKDIRLFASGAISDSGASDIQAQAYFSPNIAGEFPEGLQALLTQKSNGWMSYSMHLETGQDLPSLKFESDRIRIQFQQIEHR